MHTSMYKRKPKLSGKLQSPVELQIRFEELVVKQMQAC